MKEVSFLHIADIHLDSRFMELDKEKRTIRQIELQMTFKKILSDNADANFVLIAGDLFDGFPNKSTVMFLCKLFAEYPNTRFFIVGGNHDYIGSECVELLRKVVPDNVHIFDDCLDCITLNEFGVRVYGCSFSSPHLYSSLLSGFKCKDNNLVNIMLMHGDVDATDKYNPIDIHDISSSNLNYLALGHKHSYSGIKTAGKTSYAYPGIPEPTGFDECGTCGYIKGYIRNKNLSFEFIQCNSRSYENISIDISDLCTDSEVLDKINSKISEENLYRIEFLGEKSHSISLKEDIYKEFVNSFYCEIIDSTEIKDNILNYLGENSLKGKTAEILNEYLNKEIINDKLLKKEVTSILTELLCKGGNDL